MTSTTSACFSPGTHRSRSATGRKIGSGRGVGDAVAVGVEDGRGVGVSVGTGVDVAVGRGVDVAVAPSGVGEGLA